MYLPLCYGEESSGRVDGWMDGWMEMGWGGMEGVGVCVGEGEGEGWRG